MNSRSTHQKSNSSDIFVTLQATQVVAANPPFFQTPALSFSLKHKQPLAIYGENGAGKSTLLKTLAGLQAPLSGEISRFYEQSSCHYIDHTPVWDFQWTLEEQVLFWQHYYEVDNATTEKALTFFFLKNKITAPLYTLSSGESRRLMLMPLILKARNVWYLDEPFNFLDGKTIQLLAHLMLKQLKAGGLVIFTTPCLQSQPFDQDALEAVAVKKHA